MRNMRTYDIVEYIREVKRCTIAQVMEQFNISSATAHRDINDLARRNIVERFRGGVAFRDAQGVKPGGSNFTDRAIANLSNKRAIAKKAVSYVSDGDILFLDSSTTVLEFALELCKHDFSRLTIVTNSVSIMQEFHRFPSHWVLIGLGGTYDHQLNSFIGSDTRRQLDDFCITKSFVSAFGLNSKIATTNHERQVELIKTVLERTESRFLLVDKSKLGRTGLYRLSARGTFNTIIS